MTRFSIQVVWAFINYRELMMPAFSALETFKYLTTGLGSTLYLCLNFMFYDLIWKETTLQGLGNPHQSTSKFLDTSTYMQDLICLNKEHYRSFLMTILIIKLHKAHFVVSKGQKQREREGKRKGWKKKRRY